MLPRPINDAEAVIEAFWDQTLSELSEYTFAPGQGTGAKASQECWCWVEFFWQDATPGEPIFTMRRDVDIVIENYDALRIRCAVPSSAKLIFKAVIDGREQIIVDGIVGPDKKWEFTGPIVGKHLERLTICYEAVRGGAGGGTLQWINLVDRVTEQRRLSRSSSYVPEWPKFLVSNDSRVEFKPGLGLVFDADDLARIRKNVKHPAFKPLMDSLREQAHEFMSFQPEQYVMESAATVNRHHRAHEIDRPWFDPAGAVMACGFVGLVDQNADMLRMAARSMLAIAHSRYWDECFQEHFPGSTFDHCAFTASDYAYVCAMGLDWAGSVLSEAGRRIVLDAITRKGMPKINRDFVQCEYIYHCNQAAHFSRGRIAGLLAMRSLWPRAQAWIEQAKKDMYESIDLVFNANEDHGGREGPGYTSATVHNMLLSLCLIARDEGKTLKEVTPPELIGCGDFLLMFLSTAGNGDTLIPYGDTGGGAYALDTVTLMAMASGDRRWENLRNRMLKDGSALGQKVSGAYLLCLYTLCHSEPPDKPGRVELPTFCLLPSTGMVESCRHTPNGPVRLQLIGAAEGAGHVHQDKGSFILEAFGDVLAIDRGKLGGAHPSENVLTKAYMHNVLCPAKLGDLLEEQEMHTKHPTLPTGSGNEQTLDVRIDTTAAWINHPFKKHVRRIQSPAPTLFFIDDHVEFDRPRGATFHLHSCFPIAPKGGSFIIRGQHADLVVTPMWTPADSSYGEDFVDGSLQPVQHLVLTSQPGTSYRLVTALQVLKSGRVDFWEFEASGEDPGTIVAHRGSEEHTYMSHQ